MAIVSQTPSISEVKAVLAETANSVGGLCTSPKINKWAKFKPIRNSKVGDLLLTDFYNANYGIDLPIYSNVNAMITAMSSIGGKSPSWGYSRPTGCAISPYRIGDFRGYNDNAFPPIGAFSMTNRAAVNGGNPNINGYIIMAQGDETNIGWQDLNLAGRKLGIALKNLSTNNIYTATSAEDGAGNVTINVVDKAVPVGGYNGFLFLTNQSGGLTNIVGLDGHKTLGYIVEVVNQYVTVNVSAVWNELNPNLLEVYVSAINTTGLTVNLTNCQLDVRFGASDPMSQMTSPEQRLFGGVLTVPPTGQIGANILTRSVQLPRFDYPSWKVFWRTTDGIYPSEYEINIKQENI